ncbi:APC family permease [Actinoplanes subtropicus]|uniref:APC family permease n=1 Tax=Actinoplanes subtropicus TaxID=543632 RepID=UPI0004C2DFE2|nr:APC family permease [Actinoplanes subtropicus]
MSEQTRLKTGALGAAGISFLVVGAAAPLTVMTGVTPLAIAIGGVGAPLGYLAAGVVLAVFAVGYTAMTRHTRGAGAFYSYITLGLGRPLGAASGMLAVFSYNALQIGVYGLLGVQFAAACARFTGAEVPWWVFAVATVALVWALGRRGIDVGAWVVGVLLVAESAILLLLVVAVLTRARLTGGTFTADALSGPGMPAILGFCFAAFMGFESTALYRAEARQPDRTIPRATYAAVAFLAVFYGVVAWAVVQAFGDAEVVAAAAANPTALLFTAMEKYAGGWAADIMYVLVLTSILAAQLSFHNAINRYAFNLAHDGLLPAALGHSHPRFRSPAVAGATQSVLAVVVVACFALAGADPIRQLLILVNTPGVLGVLMLLALTSVAVLAYFLRRRGVPGARVATASSALGAVLLTLVFGVIIDKVGLLTNAAPDVDVALVAVVPMVLAAGLVWALIRKAGNPRAYARIGGEEAGRMGAAVAPAAALEVTA